MLRRSATKEAPASERILLMLMRPDETHARAPQEATEALSSAVQNYDQDDEFSLRQIFDIWLKYRAKPHVERRYVSS